MKASLKNFKIKNIKQFFKENILKNNDSNLRIALSISFGCFMSVFPTWGYQFILAMALSFVLKLNKAMVMIFTNISSGPQAVLALWASYYIGGKILSKDVSLAISEINFSMVKDLLLQFILGGIVLSSLLFCCAFLVSYFLLSIFRKK